MFLDGSKRAIGPGKSIKVLPGDQVDAEVFAKYLHVDGGYDPSVAGDVLLSGFFSGFVNAGGEMQGARCW